MERACSMILNIHKHHTCNKEHADSCNLGCNTLTHDPLTSSATVVIQIPYLRPPSHSLNLTALQRFPLSADHGRVAAGDDYGHPRQRGRALLEHHAFGSGPHHGLPLPSVAWSGRYQVRRLTTQTDRRMDGSFGR